MPPPLSLTRLRWTLFGSVFCLFLLVFKGDGGYLDVQEYLDDAQRLWLKGDLRVPDGAGGYTYNRYVLGLPFLSAPAVWFGHGLHLIAANINERSVTTLTVPLLGAVAAVLMFEWGLLLRATPRVSVAAALLFALASPFLSYIRLYFTEVLVVAAILLAVTSFVKAQSGEGGCVWRWLILAGAGLAFMPAGHMSITPAFACLSLGMALILLLDPRESVATRIKRVVVLAALPCLYVTIFMSMNYSRYGSPFTTGYHVVYADQVDQFMMFRHIPANFANFGRWLVRTPWLVVSLPALWLLWPKNKAVTVMLFATIAAQCLFWFCYRDLHVTTFRYLLPLQCLWALGLPLALQKIEHLASTRGLAYFGTTALLWTFAGFLAGDGPQAFFIDPATGEFCFFTWYMTPSPIPKNLGTPAGPVQWSVFFLLTTIALVLFISLWRHIHDMSDATDTVSLKSQQNYA